MRAYEIFINGEPLCVAGTSKGYVSACVTDRSEQTATWIDVMGLNDENKLYVRWAQRDLNPGDEILIRIVDRKTVDKPKTIRRHDEERDLASMKRYVRRMAESFGRDIQEKRKGTS